MAEDASKSYFFVGLGGSGMLPLARLVLARGDGVAGSDRSHDQGRTSAQLAALVDDGVKLSPQDGSGITSPGQVVVASAAVEASVPDIVRATELGCSRLTRAELLAELFADAPVRIAVGGTSGKSTVTGMIGWILEQAGRDPTIMNGAVMKNFGSGARVGGGEVFVSEVDESDGSIALYHPTIAVLNNVALDHKSMDELRTLFAGFLSRAEAVVVGTDNDEAAQLTPAGATRFGFAHDADVRAVDYQPLPEGSNFTLCIGADIALDVRLRVPGRHNVSNALAAIAASISAGVTPEAAVAAIATFKGLSRRMDVLGVANEITIIDDFAHNPDKIAATLTTLHDFPGRVLVFFQPHGYGPLRQMGRELAYAFRANLLDGDRLIVCDPVYFGGTVDRSQGSETLVEAIGSAAEHIAGRASCGDRLVALARPGDRIVVMGARDDSLTGFAQGLLDRLRS